MASSMDKAKSYKASQLTSNIIVYVILTILGIIWILPILWVILISFREEPGAFTTYFWPKAFSLDNYKKLFTDTSQFYFARWFINTLFVAVCSSAIASIFVLSVSYVMSRLRFVFRKPLMNIALILGMFPGFMSMIAIYHLLKAFGLEQSLISLILVYSGGAGLGFYIAKGFFDTLPRALDEAAYLDGATKYTVFFKLTLPLSKPIIVYTILTTFLAPWVDYIFASVIMGDNYENYTVALGLYKMLEREFIHTYYTQFAAGAVIVSIPISILFISMQKFYVGGVTGGAVKG